MGNNINKENNNSGNNLNSNGDRPEVYKTKTKDVQNKVHPWEEIEKDDNINNKEIGNGSYEE